MLIDPDRPHLIHHHRRDDGWLRRDPSEGELRLELHATGALVLPIDALYERLDAVG